LLPVPPRPFRLLSIKQSPAKESGKRSGIHPFSQTDCSIHKYVLKLDFQVVYGEKVRRIKWLSIHLRLGARGMETAPRLGYGRQRPS
jgi:hypothetical protein